MAGFMVGFAIGVIALGWLSGFIGCRARLVLGQPRYLSLRQGA